jgi:hypothetical protein
MAAFTPSLRPPRQGPPARTVTYSSITHAPNGLQSSWTPEGIADFVWVTNVAQSQNFYTAGPDLSSPHVVSASAYPTPSMNYYLRTTVTQMHYSITGAHPTSSLEIENTLFTTIAK